MQSELELTERLGRLEAEKVELQDQFSVEQDVVVSLRKEITDQESVITQKVNRNLCQYVVQFGIFYVSLL